MQDLADGNGEQQEDAQLQENFFFNDQNVLEAIEEEIGHEEEDEVEAIDQLEIGQEGPVRFSESEDRSIIEHLIR